MEKPALTETMQIGIVVRDLDATIRRHEDHFGIGPWQGHPFKPGDIAEWFKGTSLRPFLQSLDESEKEGFLARYVESLEREYPASEDGKVLLPFPRLFFVGSRVPPSSDR